MAGWAKRIALVCIGLSVAGCAGSRSFTWRGVKARPRVRATYAPPVAPSYAPAAIETTSPEPAAAPAPLPRETGSDDPPMPPLEPTPAVPAAPPVPPRQTLAPPNSLDEPAILFDEPLRSAAPLELPAPEPKRVTDRPASVHQEERSAVQELGEGPIARRVGRTQDTTAVAKTRLSVQVPILPVLHTDRLPGHSSRSH